MASRPGPQCLLSTSGGQPHDTGMLTAKSSGGALLEAPILAVDEDEHGEVWHTTPKPLLAGTPVRGFIDWSRRRDHMQQHSGQHLLSAVVYRQLGAATVSFHLGEMTSTIDLAREAISHEELDRVEEAVNEIIAEDRAVTMRTIPREEAEMLLAAGTLHKLPDREGDIRLIEIDDIDLNACGGTHVKTTGQIGGLLIRGTERMRQGIRVEFVCGMRAAVTARRDLSTLTHAAAALSVGRLDVAEAVDRLLAETKAAHKANQKLTEELAGYHAASLLLHHPVQGGRRLVRLVFHRPGHRVRQTVGLAFDCLLLADLRTVGHDAGGASSCGACRHSRFEDRLRVVAARGVGSLRFTRRRIARDGPGSDSQAPVGRPLQRNRGPFPRGLSRLETDGARHLGCFRNTPLGC